MHVQYTAIIHRLLADLRRIQQQQRPSADKKLGSRKVFLNIIYSMEFYFFDIIASAEFISKLVSDIRPQARVFAAMQQRNLLH
jgi:hypothetical protein